jgi:hypothetical protein
MDKTIKGLLPLESYRSPWIPTRRFGQDALVAVAAPFRQVSDVSVVPTTWFAATSDFSTLLAYARTSVVTPVTDFKSSPFESRPPTMSARDAHAFLWRLSESAWPDFFARRRPLSGVALEIEEAVDATVPGRLQPWLRLCCADFFDWVGTAIVQSPSTVR